jgi:hypothetical protein
MAHLSSFLAGGLAFVLAMDLYIAPSALETAASTGQSVAQTPGALSANVDRARKGDRLAGPHTATATPAEIAKVEVAPSGAILLRSRDGATLFSVDPAAQRTIVAKNAALPQLTIRGSGTMPAHVPTPAPDYKPLEQLAPLAAPDALRSTTVSNDRKPETTKRPSGCDPSFSPIAAPQLGHIFGRCVTSIAGATQVALAH